LNSRKSKRARQKDIEERKEDIPQTSKDWFFSGHEEE
jgi:hypothetical protein